MPMENRNIYAVLTGDLVGSSRFKIETQRDEILSILKNSFNIIESTDVIELPFTIHRGDSFQGVLSSPEDALKAAITIRASLLSTFKGKKGRLDTRIAIGIGKIEYLSKTQVGEGDGEAFRNSGMELDRMKKWDRNLVIKTPWHDINEELKTECTLLDALIQRWTKEQSEAILYHLEGATQSEVAEKLDIKQSAVSQRLKTGGFRAVHEFLERYKAIIQYNVRG